jgi:very-short-patch-repair endonuclease
MARDLALVRRLRREQTDAEARLWARLRNRVLGPKFRNQFPFGPYVLDLWCVEARLAVEVDGAHHVERDQVTEVLLETDPVVQRFAELLAERAFPHTPALSPAAGERGPDR